MLSESKNPGHLKFNPPIWIFAPNRHRGNTAIAESEFTNGGTKKKELQSFIFKVVNCSLNLIRWMFKSRLVVVGSELAENLIRYIRKMDQIDMI